MFSCCTSGSNRDPEVVVVDAQAVLHEPPLKYLYLDPREIAAKMKIEAWPQKQALAPALEDRSEGATSALQGVKQGVLPWLPQVGHQREALTATDVPCFLGVWQGERGGLRKKATLSQDGGVSDLEDAEGGKQAALLPRWDSGRSFQRTINAI